MIVIHRRDAAVEVSLFFHHLLLRLSQPYAILDPRNGVNRMVRLRISF